ncbi:hypothetical protein [Nocardia noduli]|uniref:hypothetical protein n=1 Tax=Nocardia noduli TaxID=2815722 RepID=UPI001C21792C|nr:hypothetical protein [Nocardia noduli]
MRLPSAWICIDVIGTAQHGEIMVHTVGEKRVSRSLRRVGAKLGFDHGGQALFTSLVSEALEATSRVDRAKSEGDLEFHTKWVIAPDQVAVALVVWLAPAPVAPRPIYNAWILDLQRITTRSAGDNLAIIGDGRIEGEERPIRDLLTNANVDDTPNFLALYWDALRGDPGLLAEAYWTIRSPERWVHFWSAARVPTYPTSVAERQIVHGISVEIAHRDVVSTMSTMVAFTESTLLIVDADALFPVTTTGKLAPLEERHIKDILDQLDLPDTAALAHAPVEQPITIEGSVFRCTAFALPTVQQRLTVKPVAILLKPEQSTR